MRNSSLGSYYTVLLIILTSCGHSEGDWGATVGNCDVICTVYYTAQRELMKDRKLYDRDFPNKADRRNHITEINNGHKVESWFNTVDETQDTTIHEFSCEVYYNSERIGYVVKNLKMKN